MEKLTLRVAHLLAVGALDAGPVLWLRALLTQVTDGVTVPANEQLLICAVLLTVTFLTTVVAFSTSARSGTVPREVTDLSVSAYSI